MPHVPVVHDRRPARAVIAAGVVVLASGTFGYMWIEGWTLVESAYMTVITLSTVGFGEVQSLSPPGRLFTIGLILGGVATLSYAITALGEQIPRRRERRLERRIRHMNDHVIICGYARMSQEVVAGFIRRREDFCVIERDADQVHRLQDRGIPVIKGDATLESVLQGAGITRARAIAALLPSDADNLSIAMTASGLKPGVRILARSERDRSRANLVRAGARDEDVISPHGAAGIRLLQNLVHPEGAQILGVLHNLMPLGLEVERLVVAPEDPIAGKTLAEGAIAPGQRVMVIAIERDGAEPIFAPGGDQLIRAGDSLLLLCHHVPKQPRAHWQ